MPAIEANKMISFYSLIELIQAEGGNILFGKEFWVNFEELATENDIFWMLDEFQPCWV